MKIKKVNYRPDGTAEVQFKAYMYDQEEVEKLSKGKIDVGLDLGSRTITNGGDETMNLYRFAIVDRTTGIVMREGWVVGEDREEGMVGINAEDYSLDNVKVILNKFGSYEPIE